MVAVPDAIPVTAPVGSTVAIDVALLVQLPPVEVSVIEITEPTHTDVGPPMVAGTLFTDTVAVMGDPHPLP